MSRPLRLLALLVLLLVLWVPAAGAWTWPVGGPVLQGFSFDPAHPYAGGQHRGIDVGGDAGASVLAPASGVVSFAGTVPTSGKSVTIDTADGLSVTLTHLGSIAVAKGGAVTEGTVVGTVGPSGTPELDVPYVHLGIRNAADPQGYLDPLLFLPGRGGAARRAPAAAPVAPPAAVAPPAEPALAPPVADAPPRRRLRLRSRRRRLRNLLLPRRRRRSTRYRLSKPCLPPPAPPVAEAPPAVAAPVEAPAQPEPAQPEPAPAAEPAPVPDPIAPVDASPPADSLPAPEAPAFPVPVEASPPPSLTALPPAPVHGIHATVAPTISRPPAVSRHVAGHGAAPDAGAFESLRRTTPSVAPVVHPRGEACHRSHPCSPSRARSPRPEQRRSG